MVHDDFYILVSDKIVVAKMPNNGSVPSIVHSTGETNAIPTTTLLYELNGRIVHCTTKFKLTSLGSVSQVRRSDDLALKIWPSVPEQVVKLTEDLISGFPPF